jgi:hypothetical protein
MLAAAGEDADPKRYADVAAEFKKPILAAIEKSVSRKTSPPFVPVALFGDEPVHDPILHSRIGSYWNIIIGYMMASGIFPPGSEEESWIAHYQEQHGGLCMGMLRAGGGQFNFWTSDNRINPLYGTRYALDTMRRDDPERALVALYGMLAQGFTSNTFICGEDFKVERAPTAFGPVSLNVKSKLAQGEVVAEVQLPDRNTPQKTLLRARVPDGWKVVSAQAGDKKLATDEQGTADIPFRKGQLTIRFAVA